jgi:hypothetical protein
MTVYSYDPKTGEYTGETIADPSPLEPGGYLYPANTTETAPPSVGKHTAAVWDGHHWNVVEDWRGKSGYVNGEPFEIKNLGPLSKGWSDTPPPPSEEELNEQRRAEILARLAAIDYESIRPLRAIADGTATNKEREKLVMLESEAKKLREEISQEAS